MFTFLLRAPQAGGYLLCSQPGVEFTSQSETQVWGVVASWGTLPRAAVWRVRYQTKPHKLLWNHSNGPYIMSTHVPSTKGVLEQFNMNRLFPWKRVDRVGGGFLWRQGHSCFNFSSPGGTLTPMASLEQVPIWMPMWDSKCKLSSWAIGPWIPIGQNVQVYWLGGSGVLSITASRESALHVG